MGTDALRQALTRAKAVFIDCFNRKVTLAGAPAADLPSKIAVSRYFGGQILRQNSFLIDDILSALDAPRICTRDDVIECGLNHLALGIIDDDFEGAFERFVSELECVTSFERKSNVFRIFKGVSNPGSTEDGTLWQENGYAMRLCGEMPESHDPDEWKHFLGFWDLPLASIGLSQAVSEIQHPGTALRVRGEPNEAGQSGLHVQVSGCCTARAMHDLMEEIKGISDVVERSLRLTADERNLQIDGGRAILVLGRCLNTRFGKHGKKDRLDLRLANAIQLLREACTQSNSAIVLALAFSAIEALLSFDNEAISDKLGRNVATLLVPDKSRRLEYIKYTKGLYKTRSNVLHGTEVRLAKHQDEIRALNLAFAAIRAILCWREHARRMNKPEELTSEFELFESELAHATASGQIMVGVPEESISWVADDLESS